MNGRSGLTTISWPRRQTSPRMSLKSVCPSGQRRQLARPVRRVVLLEERLDDAGRSNWRPSRWSIRSRSVRSGSPRRPKSSAGNGRSVSLGIGVMCVPKAIVVAPIAFAQERPVHVVLQRRRGELRHVVLRPLARGGSPRTPSSPCARRSRRRSSPSRSAAAAPPSAPATPAARSCSRAIAARRGAATGSRWRRRASAGSPAARRPCWSRPRAMALSRAMLSVFGCLAGRTIRRVFRPTFFSSDMSIEARSLTRPPPLSLHPRSTRAGPT